MCAKVRQRRMKPPSSLRGGVTMCVRVCVCVGAPSFEFFVFCGDLCVCLDANQDHMEACNNSLVVRRVVAIGSP